MKYLSLVAILLFSLSSCEQDTKDKGMSAYGKKNYKKAIEQFTDYLETHPKDADTYFNRGRAYEQLGQLEKALEDYQAAIAEDPNKEEFWLSSGIANFKMEKYEQTVSNMDGLLELQESNGKAMVLKARAYTKMGTMKNIGYAMKTLDKAITQNSSNGEAYLYRGLIRANANDSQACDDLGQAKRLKIKRAQKYINKYCE